MELRIKKTALLVAELRAIARTVDNEYSAQVLNEAAERLEDTDVIASFFRKEAIKLKKE